MAILGITADPTLGGYSMPTENAATIFGMLAGVGNAIGGLMASENLTNIDSDRVLVSRLVPGVIVVGIGSLVGGLLAPGGRLSPF